MQAQEVRAARARRWAGILLQIAAMISALLLALWLFVVLAVTKAYTYPPSNGVTLDARQLIYLWLAIWVPMHFAAAGFLTGRLMSRSSPGRTLSSDRSH